MSIIFVWQTGINYCMGMNSWKILSVQKIHEYNCNHNNGDKYTSHLAFSPCRKRYTEDIGNHCGNSMGFVKYTSYFLRHYFMKRFCIGRYCVVFIYRKERSVSWVCILFVAGGGYSLGSASCGEWKLGPQGSIYRSGSWQPGGPGRKLFQLSSVGPYLPLGGRLLPVLQAAGSLERDTEPLFRGFLSLLLSGKSLGCLGPI